MPVFTDLLGRTSGGELAAVGVLFMVTSFPVFGVGRYLHNDVITGSGIVLLVLGLAVFFGGILWEGISRRRVRNSSKAEQ